MMSSEIQIPSSGIIEMRIPANIVCKRGGQTTVTEMSGGGAEVVTGMTEWR